MWCNAPMSNVDRIVRQKEVCHLTGLSKTSLYREVAEGRFPPPLRLGPRMVGWRLSTVQQWVQELTHE